MTQTNGAVTHTNDVAEEVDAIQPSADAAQDAGATADTVAQRAGAIREQHGYKGRLTNKLLNALYPLLEQEPSPHAAKGRGDEDKGFEHLLFQRRVMDEVLSPVHWCDLIHYEDGGQTARAWVIVGNRLGRLRLDETTGALIVDDKVEILKKWESWGGWHRADSKGDLLKSTDTTTLRRLLAKIGPGHDAFERSAEDPAQEPGPELRGPYAPDRTAIAGAGERKADELDVKLLLKVIRERGLPASQVANLIRAAARARECLYDDEKAAAAFVDERLDDRRIVLSRHLVGPLKRLLEEAAPALPLEAGDGSPSAGDAGRKVGTLPFEPGGARAA